MFYKQYLYTAIVYYGHEKIGCLNETSNIQIPFDAKWTTAKCLLGIFNYNADFQT